MPVAPENIVSLDNPTLEELQEEEVSEEELHNENYLLEEIILPEKNRWICCDFQINANSNTQLNCVTLRSDLFHAPIEIVFTNMSISSNLASVNTNKRRSKTKTPA